MEKPMNQKQFQTFAVKRFTEMEKFQVLVLEQFALIREQFTALKTEMRDGFKEVHAEIAGIKAILTPLSKAVNTDSEKIVDHDKRLVRVEKVLGIKKA